MKIFLKVIISNFEKNDQYLTSWVICEVGIKHAATKTATPAAAKHNRLLDDLVLVLSAAARSLDGAYVDAVWYNSSSSVQLCSSGLNLKAVCKIFKNNNNEDYCGGMRLARTKKSGRFSSSRCVSGDN